MNCPKCKGKVKTVKSVEVSWNENYRKRKCVDCGHKFFTAEFEVIPNRRFMKEWELYSFNAEKID